MDDEYRARGASEGRRAFENRVTFLIPSTRARVNTPGGGRITIYGHGHGASDTLRVALIVKVGFEGSLKLRDIGRGFGKLHCRPICGRGRIHDLNLELGKGAGALKGTAGSIARQVGVIEQFEPEGRDRWQLIGQDRKSVV